jgi:hypothetical protein
MRCCTRTLLCVYPARPVCTTVTLLQAIAIYALLAKDRVQVLIDARDADPGHIRWEERIASAVQLEHSALQLVQPPTRVRSVHLAATAI